MQYHRDAQEGDAFGDQIGSHDGFGKKRFGA